MRRGGRCTYHQHISYSNRQRHAFQTASHEQEALFLGYPSIAAASTRDLRAAFPCKSSRHMHMEKGSYLSTSKKRTSWLHICSAPTSRSESYLSPGMRILFESPAAAESLMLVALESRDRSMHTICSTFKRCNSQRRRRRALLRGRNEVSTRKPSMLRPVDMLRGTLRKGQQ